MGELQRAQEFRVDEISVQKMRESHGTIQRLTSQIQELQERVNYMNCYRDFQETELNYNGNLSHILSQAAVVPSLRSMLSRYRRLPLDTWNLSGTQGNVYGNPRAVLDSSQTLHEGILHSMNQSATSGISVQRSTRTPVARGEERIGSTTTMPSFARRPSTVNSILPADIPQNSIVGQQGQQISEL